MLATLIVACLSCTATAQDQPPIVLHSAIGAGVADNDSTNSPNGKFFVGRLERVQKNDGKSKRWALMDADNQVAAFVAPTTKYDLRRYLGKEIGVTARTFSEPDGAPPYVLIDAVTPMFANEWTAEPAASPSRTVLASHETVVPPVRLAEAPHIQPAIGTPIVPNQVIQAQQWESVIDLSLIHI